MDNQLDYEINKELGECYLFMGDLDKAEEYYRKAVANDGEHSDPYLGLATVAIQRGNIDDALVLYRKAAAIEACDKSLSGIGLVLMEKGKHEEAFATFLKALERNPQNMIATHCAVQEAHYLNRLEEILPCLEHFLALEPDNRAVRISLVGCLASMGRQKDAVVHLEELLKLNPEDTEAKELFDALAA